jgi:hypothetical protein
MTQRTRYFLVGSALVLTLGLGTGLVAFYNGNLPLRTASVGPSELAYLPQTSAGIAFADVRSIMTSEFRQKLRQVLPTGEAKDELLRETGIDIENDIDIVVAGFTPPAAGTSMEQGAVVLVRGRFDVTQIETLATQHGAAVEEYGGKRMLVFGKPDGTMLSTPHGTVSGKPGLAFLEPGLLGLGPAPALKAAIDSAAKQQDVTKNADLMKLVSEVSGGSNAWVVSQFDAIANNANLPTEISSRLPAVQWFAASVNVNGGVNGVLRAETRDDQSADQLRDIIRGGLAAARLVSGNDPKADALVNSLQVMGTGRNVSVSFTLPAEIIEMIHGVAGLRHNGGSDEPKPAGRIER